MFNSKQQQPNTPQHFKVFLYEGSDVTLSNKTFKEEQPKSVHRFILDQFSLSFDEFVQKLKDKSIVTSTTFKLFYLDDQNDWVSLSDEEDWKVLGSILNSETVIKIVCKNVIPKNETTENPQYDFFKNFRKCHGRKQCPFGSNFNPCAGGLGAGFGRGGMEQFAPIIENVMGSLFKNPQNQQQGNPMGNVDLSSLLNTFFPGASNSAQQEPKQTNEQSTPTESNTNQQAPPQFNGLHDLINNFCGKLNGGLNNGTLNIPHFGVVCDGCGKRNFTGARWNCGDCGDFDFCQDCFDTKANDHFDGFHSFTQVEPKGKTFLDNIMKKMEEHKHASSNQQPEQDETPVASQTASVDEKTQPEEQLDEQLYPTIEPVDIPSVTTSQLLSSQLDIPVEQVPEVVQQSPVEQAPPVLSFATEHQLLKDMGFDNEEVNTRLLKKYNGNVQRVITDLL